MVQLVLLALVFPALLPADCSAIAAGDGSTGAAIVLLPAGCSAMVAAGVSAGAMSVSGGACVSMYVSAVRSSTRPPSA